jgi:MFS family permease
MTGAQTASTRPVLSPAGKAALLLATAFALMSTAIPAPALPQMADHFAGQAHHEALPRLVLGLIGLIADQPDSPFIIKFFVLSVAALFIAIGAPVMGRLCDRWGRRPVLIASLTVFGISGAWGFIIDNLTALLISRAILGLAVGGIKASTIAMAGDYFHGTARNRFLGLQGSVMKWGGVAFLLIGSGLANTGWRVPFLVYLVAFVIAPAVIARLPESRPQRPARPPGQRREPIPPLAAGTVFLAAFIGSVAFFVTPTQAPFFVKQTFAELAPFWRGFAIVATNIVATITATVYFRVKARYSYGTVFSLIFLLIAAGYFIVSLANSYGVMLAGIALAGCGFGLIVPNQSAWILAIVPASRRGYAIGGVTTAMYLGQFAAPIIIEAFKAPGDPHAVFRNIAGVLLVLAALYFAAGRLRRA